MATAIAVPLRIFTGDDTTSQDDPPGGEFTFQLVRVIRKAVENASGVVRTTFWAVSTFRFHFAEPLRRHA